MKARVETNNIEITRKILNSVAHTYDCGVSFEIKDGRLDYTGPKDCAIEIARQAAGIFER